jgi:diguanylate cyclase (GGDEF)-like protein
MQIQGKNKIGRRIIALVLVSVLLSIVTVTGIFAWLQLGENIANRKAGIEATGYIFAAAIADHVAAGDSEEVLKTLRSVSRVPDVSYVAAFDADGSEIAAFGSTVLAGEDLEVGSDDPLSLLSRGSLPVAVGITKGGRAIGRLILVADVSGLRGTLMRNAIVMAMIALAAGLLGLAVAVRFQRRITAPILSLTTAMRRIRDAQDYSAKVEHSASDETGMLVDTFNRMITEIGVRDQRLERLAYFDPLTGTANRQLFHQNLERTLKQNESRAALFLLDLDGFKIINDTFGHSVGDALLVNVATVLQGELKDRLHLARLGGDEFALIAPGTATEQGAEAIAARIVAALLRPALIDGREIFVTTSIGIVMMPRDGSSPEDLLRRADLALYSAKREGPSRVKFYRPTLDEEVQQRSELAGDLRRALETGALEVQYQPQADLAAGEVVGFESLLRWKHPERGYISPAVFIPIAEESNLICDLGLWILRESCRQAQAWIDAGQMPRQVSVNVSMAQIRQAEFHLDVANILRDTGLRPSLLCLELTESLFIGTSRRRANFILEALKQTGISLAIDDFGTGYSSLSYLQELPFDKLKIDRAFIGGVDIDPSRRRLLKGIVELGHALGKSVVAEGAETNGEIDVLRQLRADQVQGYIFSRPLPAAEALAAAAAISEEFSMRFSGAGTAALLKRT